jgi:hypothetical protein
VHGYRVIGVAMLCALGACYSPGFKDCEITCASGACPSGFRCDQGVCRADGVSGPCGQTGDSGIDTPDGDPGLDSDNDGVNDAIDNCPSIANANQGNEDQDARGDVCDPCPIKALAADDADSDGDGVGDGCDPDSSAAAAPHRITLFEGFSGTLPSSVTVVPANAWTVTNGAARANLSGGTTPQRGWLTWPHQTPQNSQDIVFAKVTVNQKFPGAVQNGVGIVQRADGNLGDGIVCWIASQADGTMGLRLFYTTDAFSGMSAGGNYFANQVATLRLQRTAEQYSCIDLATNLMAQTSFTFNPGNAQLGFYVEGAGASYEWVMVVSHN